MRASLFWRQRMRPSDLDIARSAHLWIQQYCDQATAKAREMVDEMRRKGDTAEAPTSGSASSWRSMRDAAD